MSEKITIGRVIFYLEPPAATLITRFLLVNRIQLNGDCFLDLEELLAEMFLERIQNDRSPLSSKDVKEVIRQLV